MRNRVLARAKWHDVKHLLLKVGGDQSSFFVRGFNWGGQKGWLVEFDGVMPADSIKENIYGVVVVGEHAIWIGIQDA